MKKYIVILMLVLASGCTHGNFASKFAFREPEINAVYKQKRSPNAQHIRQEFSDVDGKYGFYGRSNAHLDLESYYYWNQVR